MEHTPASPPTHAMVIDIVTGDEQRLPVDEAEHYVAADLGYALRYDE